MKCVFLDRDGVINKDFVDYAYTLDRFIILPGVLEAVSLLKQSGYLLVVVTNQSGIVKGIYTREQMHECHQYMQQVLDHQIDRIYYSPWHQSHSESLSRKPGTLMFEKAVAKFGIDVSQSWMIGDKKRDMIPAQKMGLKTIQVGGDDDKMADYVEKDLLAAAKRIISL
ncbi:MAG: D-glycero-D-manno-heptose 1,7-bisphosphate phosphatase [Cyclobacteriaceae bacterium]|jgi:D-glycero-D-manno-heptose 1,7-bisphosphate phosphatase